MGEATEVSVRVDAPPEKVWSLVSDLSRMGEWSPETVRVEWLDGASGPSVGARFKGFNRRGARRWSTKGRIVAADPGRELAWDVSSFGLSIARWRYRITPADGGSEISESTEDTRGRIMHILGRVATGVSDRKTHNADGMRQTLERIKAAAERS